MSHLPQDRVERVKSLAAAWAIQSSQTGAFSPEEANQAWEAFSASVNALTTAIPPGHVIVSAADLALALPHAIVDTDTTPPAILSAQGRLRAIAEGAG